MEVSNGGGVALVGVGSEWFWIALQFFALAGTFFAIYRQLRAQQREIQESTKAQLSLGYNNAIRLGQRPLEMLIQDDKLARIASVGYATLAILASLSSWINISRGRCPRRIALL